MDKLIRAAPTLGRLGGTVIALVFLLVMLCLVSFCLLVILKTSPTPLLYPLGALI